MKFFRKYFKIFIILLITCVLTVQYFNRPKIEIDGYNAENAYNITKELSSEKYKGRRYGTNENAAAVKYIEEQFKSIGLEPAGRNNSYLREYGAMTRSYNGAAALQLLDENGSLVKEYKYGEDFIEQGYDFSAPGDIISGYKAVEIESMLENAPDSALIALLSSENNDSSQINEFKIPLIQAGYKALVRAVPDDNDFSRVSAGIGDRTMAKTGYEMPVLIIKDSVYRELSSNEDKGYRLHAKSTFDVTAAAISDVMGMIPGNSGEYLFITAHLDGVGPSSDGTVYPGALDNASGVGVMIELARYIKSQGKTPSANIVFIAFNGEEGGLLGSKNYVFNPLYPLDKTKVINIDMVGTKEDMPLTFMYLDTNSMMNRKGVDPSSKLRYHLAQLADKMGININEVNEFNSDHSFFGSFGVPAVTLIDYDKKTANTPLDTFDRINKENMDRAIKLVMSYISLTAYSNITASGYSVVGEELLNFIKCAYPIILGLAAAGILLWLKYRGKLKSKILNTKLPALSIILIILAAGLISYFPLRYPYAPSQNGGAASLIFQSFISIFSGLLLIPLYCGFTLPGLIALFITEQRVRSMNYRGNGKEIKTVYYFVLFSVVAISYILSALFSRQIYLAVTPDFARYAAGRIAVLAVCGAAAYLFTRFISLEAPKKRSVYSNMLIFSIVFFILLSAFYMPISMNKQVIDSRISNMNF